MTGSDQNDKPSTWNSVDMRRIYGAGQFYCQTGSPEQRRPEIVADPDTDPSRIGNKVVAIRITESDITMPGMGEEKSSLSVGNQQYSAATSRRLCQTVVFKNGSISPNFSVLENAKVNNVDTNNIG
jgi:hypothetical protein